MPTNSAAPAPLQLFASETGLLQDRWEAAFERAEGIPLERLRALRRRTRNRPAAVWLRLRQQGSAAEQVKGAVALAGQVPLVALADRPSDDEAMAVLASGARGYCNTHAAPPVLQAIWSTVEQGGLWVGESLLLRLIRGVAGLPGAMASGHPGSPQGEQLQTLTPRERDVATWVGRGASNAEMASQLGMSDADVRSALAALQQKLLAPDRLHLACHVTNLQTTDTR